MNILLVDTEAVGLDLALRFTAAGHKVRWYLDSKKPTKVGHGFREFEMVSDWRGSVSWAKSGLVIPTGNSKFVKEYDRLRDFGIPIFGPTAKSAEIETNRGIGMQTMIDCGIDVPKYHVFKTMAEAERFQMKTDQAFVFKVLDGSVEDKALTYVSSDPADMVGWLRRHMKHAKNIKECMLQEKIDADFEVGINGWFGPDGFLPNKYQLSFEHKPLMSGDIGPNTGEACAISQYVENDKLVGQMLTPLVGALRKAGHRGDFCIGCMIDKSGKAWPLEATARFGYPSTFMQLASHKGDPVQWMKDLLDGKDTLKVSYDVCAGVVMGQPNYPYEMSSPEEVEGNPIDIDEGVMDNLHLCGVMKGKGPVMKAGKVVEADTYQTAAEYVMVATAMGKTIARARDKVYRSIDGVKFPNMIYRDDCGEKVDRALPKMRQAGYALEMQDE